MARPYSQAYCARAPSIPRRFRWLGINSMLPAFLILAGPCCGLTASADRPPDASSRRGTDQQQAQQNTVHNLRIATLIDFENKATGPFRRMPLARIATEALADELARADLYHTIKQEEVGSAVRALGLHPPLSGERRKKLENFLNADVVVTGNVAFVHIDAEAVHAGLIVRIVDLQTDELIGEAAQIGEIRRTAHARSNALVAAAIRDAATRAVKQVRDFMLPEGRFLSCDERSRTLVIDHGSQDHLQVGMELVVIRNGKRVSKVRVTKANPTTAECQVTLYEADVKPSDTWRAVYPQGLSPVIAYRHRPVPRIRIWQ